MMNRLGVLWDRHSDASGYRTLLHHRVAPQYRYSRSKHCPRVARTCGAFPNLKHQCKRKRTAMSDVYIPSLEGSELL